MILHISFSDGANPWVSMNQDRHTIAKKWRRWLKNHPTTAKPSAIYNGWKCYPIGGGGYAVGRYFDGAHKTYHYMRLGNALAALERLGGGKA